MVKKSNCSKSKNVSKVKKTELKGILAINPKDILCIRLNKVQSE